MMKVCGHDEDGHEKLYEGAREVAGYLGKQALIYTAAFFIGIPLKAMGGVKRLSRDSRLETGETK